MKMPPSIRAPMLSLVVTASILVLPFARLVDGFTPIQTYNPNRHLTRYHHTVLLAASAGGERQDYGTLYDVLGASPNDSYQTLRQKYTALVKKLHPDTSSDDRLDVSEFTQIVAAWKVLADPKERLKYDRSLKAKEFTDSMENLFDTGIKTAIPFMKKTADTTIAAVDQSSKTIGKMSQQMSVAMELRDLDRKRISLEQQATRESRQAQKLKDELKVIDKKRMDKLMDSTVKLSSMDALRILESFDIVEASRTASVKEIELLQNVEQEFKEKQKQRQDMERVTKNAEQSVENAVAREKLAKQRLEEAKREVKEAKLNMETCLKAQREATAKEKTTVLEMDKTFLSLENNTEKVRSTLRKREGESLQRESTNLRKESARLEEAALQLKREAEKIKVKANAIKREQDKQK